MTSLAERFRAKIFELRTSHKSRLTFSLLLIAASLFVLFAGIFLIRVLVNLCLLFPFSFFHIYFLQNEIVDPRFAIEFPRGEFNGERFPAVAICPGWAMVSDGGDNFHIEEGKINSVCRIVTSFF